MIGFRGWGGALLCWVSSSGRVHGYLNLGFGIWMGLECVCVLVGECIEGREGSRVLTSGGHGEERKGGRDGEGR